MTEVRPNRRRSERRTHGRVVRPALCVRLVVAVAVCFAMVAGTLSACTDRTEVYCDELAKQADLSALVAALNSKDLPRATDEARKLGELADRAPQEIRVDMQALAQSVLDIVALLKADQKQAPNSSVEGDSSAQVDQDRNQLNRRFDDLDVRSARVSRWASEKCGLKL